MNSTFSIKIDIKHNDLQKIGGGGGGGDCPTIVSKIKILDIKKTDSTAFRLMLLVIVSLS